MPSDVRGTACPGRTLIRLSFTPGKFPDRMEGGALVSRIPSFSAGLARTYASVVLMSACPSHNETFRISSVACRIVIAVECRSACGVTRLVSVDGTFWAAVGDMLLEDVCEAARAHCPAPGVEEQVAVVDGRPDVEPFIEDGFRFPPQRQFAIAPPLAQDADSLKLGTRQAVEGESGPVPTGEVGRLLRREGLYRIVWAVCSSFSSRATFASSSCTFALRGLRSGGLSTAFCHSRRATRRRHPWARRPASGRRLLDAEIAAV